jgi:phage baseplate assembly protein W
MLVEGEQERMLIASLAEREEQAVEETDNIHQSVQMELSIQEAERAVAEMMELFEMVDQVVQVLLFSNILLVIPQLLAVA